MAIKNSHKKCSSKLSSKIVIKNCHQRLSSKIVIKNCHQKLSSKYVIKIVIKIVIKNCLLVSQLVTHSGTGVGIELSQTLAWTAKKKK